MVLNNKYLNVMRKFGIILFVVLVASFGFTACESSLDEIQVEEVEYENTTVDDEDEGEGELG